MQCIASAASRCGQNARQPLNMGRHLKIHLGRYAISFYHLSINLSMIIGYIVLPSVSFIQLLMRIFIESISTSVVVYFTSLPPEQRGRYQEIVRIGGEE